MSAESKVAIVTGASRGIGRSVALRLSALGYSIALLANESSEAVEKEILTAGRIARTYRVDVCSSREVNEAVMRVEADFGDVDVLINCAGIAYYGGVSLCSQDEWERTIDVNLNGYFRMIKEVFPRMKKRGTGAIVNMSSVWGRQGGKDMVAYSVSKYGIEGLTSALAPEAAACGVKVTSLILDKVDTDFREAMTKHVNFTHDARARMLRAEDVADTVAFVLSSSPMCLPESITLKAWRF